MLWYNTLNLKNKTLSNTFFGGVLKKKNIKLKHSFERLLIKKLITRFKIYNVSIKQLEHFWLTDLGVQLQEIWFPTNNIKGRLYLKKLYTKKKNSSLISNIIEVWNLRQVYSLYRLSGLLLMFNT